MGEIVCKSFHELTVDELYDILSLRVDVFVVEQKCAYRELDDIDKKAMHVFMMEDGKIVFSADSDAIITKGIISLLIKIYSGRRPDEIVSSDFSVVDRIGLKENLSPTRANGLVSMIAKIKEVAAENL